MNNSLLFWWGRRIFFRIFFIIFFQLFSLSFCYAQLEDQIKGRFHHYINQGRIKYDMSQYEEAIKWWRKAQALEPEDKRLKRMIDRAKRKLLRSKKGFFTLRKTQLGPDVEPPHIPFEKPNKQKILTLSDAVKIGVHNHVPIQVAEKQVKLSELKVKEAFRELFPSAFVKWDESRGVVSDMDFRGRRYQFKMSHPLYHGGELRYTWEQAKANLKIAKENYKKTIEDYTSELVRSYYTLVKAERNYKVQERLLNDLKKYLSISKAEYEKDIVPLVDFLNVQSEYNRVYYASLSSQNNLMLSRVNFLQLLNLDETEFAELKIDTEIEFKEFDIDIDKCIKLAYENRPELKIKELALEVAEYGQKVAKSRQLPQIDLTGMVGRSGEVFTPSDIQLSDEWFLGAMVNIPWGPNTLTYSYKNENIAPSLTVFTPTENEVHSLKLSLLDNLSSYTDIKKAEVDRQQAFADYLRTKQTISAEVREAYFKYQEAVLMVKNSLANQELYEKELLITKEKRSINEAETLDIVLAEEKLASEKINYNSVLTDYIIALKDLNKAIGIKDYFK